jgi:MFS family permease
LCFAYFAIYAGGSVGIQSFSVSAMSMQYGIATTLASAALTGYMVASAIGILAGGFLATRFPRHDLIAASGLAAGTVMILVVASGQIPGAALPGVLAFAGFLLGSTGPSRDFIVKAATPAGATGRIYGFVYSGLDVGSVLTPVAFGWLLDHRLPQGAFYMTAGMFAIAIVTVLQLPGRTRQPAPT